MKLNFRHSSFVYLLIIDLIRDDIINMYFKTIPNKYRPLPFWSWNEKSDKSETTKQIKLFEITKVRI